MKKAENRHSRRETFHISLDAQKGMKPETCVNMPSKIVLTPTTMKSVTQFLESEECLQNLRSLENGNLVVLTEAPKTSFVNSKNIWGGGTTTVVSPAKCDSVENFVVPNVNEDIVKEEEEEDGLAEVEETRLPYMMRTRGSAAKRKSDDDFVSSDIVSPPPKRSAAQRRRGGRKPAAHSSRGGSSEDDGLSPEEAERIRLRRQRNKEAAARCRKRRVDQTNSLLKEVEEHEAQRRLLEEEIQKLKAEKEDLEYVLQAHTAVCKLQLPQQPLAVAIKSEPLHSSILEDSVKIFNNPPKRPMTLVIPSSTSPASSSGSDVAIETPSSVIPSSSLGFDSVTTGLTPMGAPSLASIATPMVPLLTPTLNTPVNSCSLEQRAMEGGEQNSPKYVSL